MFVGRSSPLIVVWMSSIWCLPQVPREQNAEADALANRALDELSEGLELGKNAIVRAIGGGGEGGRKEGRKDSSRV